MVPDGGVEKEGCGKKCSKKSERLSIYLIGLCANFMHKNRPKRLKNSLAALFEGLWGRLWAGF
jgi:hypothetical protein